MIVRIKLAIEQEEYSALVKLALSEMRNPEEQLHFIQREKLANAGLLSSRRESRSNSDKIEASHDRQIIEG